MTQAMSDENNRENTQDENTKCPKLKLDFLEAEFSKLKNIRWLDLRHRNIKLLPENIDSLEMLEVLLLNDNLIKELPLSLRNLEKLYCLHVFNNPLIFPKESIVKLGTREILNYLNFFSHSPEDHHDYESKKAYKPIIKSKEYIKQSKIYDEKRRKTQVNNSSSKWSKYKKQSQRHELSNMSSEVSITDLVIEKTQEIEDKSTIKAFENSIIQADLQKIRDKLMKERWLEKSKMDQYFFQIVYSRKTKEEIKAESHVRILLSPFDISENCLRVLTASENHLQKLERIINQKPKHMSIETRTRILELDRRRIVDLVDGIKSLRQEITQFNPNDDTSDEKVLIAMNQLNRAVEIFKLSEQLQIDMHYFGGSCRRLVT